MSTVAVEGTAPRSVCVPTRLDINSLEVGQIFEVVRKVRYRDILLTALTSRDFNRLHWDPSFARKQGHSSAVAHGVFSLGIISSAVARLLREGCMVIHLEAKFRSVLCAGDVARGVLSVASKNHRGLIGFEVSLVNEGSGTEVCRGACKVMLPRG